MISFYGKNPSGLWQDELKLDSITLFQSKMIFELWPNCRTTLGLNFHLPVHHRSTTHLQNSACLKLVFAWSSFQCTESHAAAGQRRDIAKVCCTQSFCLVIFSNQLVWTSSVSLVACGAVELVRYPVTGLGCSLVDGEALWPTGFELEFDVCNIKWFTCKTRGNVEH